MERRKFSDKMGDFVRHLLSCCDRNDEDVDRPALKISAPTDFRREDVSIPGLTGMQQTDIREKARDDAKEMWDNLQPLKSSPSENFAERPALPPYEEKCRTPSHRSNASPKSPQLSVNKRLSTGNRLDRVKAHSRKISNHLAKPLGLNLMDRDDSRYEMRALMSDRDIMMLSPAKLSVESFSVAGSEEERSGMKF